jgi:hypothetical protein
MQATYTWLGVGLGLGLGLGDGRGLGLGLGTGAGGLGLGYLTICSPHMFGTVRGQELSRTCGSDAARLIISMSQHTTDSSRHMSMLTTVA